MWQCDERPPVLPVLDGGILRTASHEESQRHMASERCSRGRAQGRTFAYIKAPSLSASNHAIQRSHQLSSSCIRKEDSLASLEATGSRERPHRPATRLPAEESRGACVLGRYRSVWSAACSQSPRRLLPADKCEQPGRPRSRLGGQRVALPAHREHGADRICPLHGHRALWAGPEPSDD